MRHAAVGTGAEPAPGFWQHLGYAHLAASTSTASPSAKPKPGYRACSRCPRRQCRTRTGPQTARQARDGGEGSGHQHREFCRARPDARPGDRLADFSAFEIALLVKCSAGRVMVIGATSLMIRFPGRNKDRGVHRIRCGYGILELARTGPHHWFAVLRDRGRRLMREFDPACSVVRHALPWTWPASSASPTGGSRSHALLGHAALSLWN